MGALLLVVLYLASAFGVGWVATSLGGRTRRPTRLAWLVLTLLPLAFTASGFLKDRTFAPTVTLAGIPPWSSPPLVEIMRRGPSEANLLLLDPLSEMEPWRFAARRNLLFNPAQGGGAALLANSQSAVLFPFEIVARLLSPVRAATYLQAIRLLLAGWGLFLLARRLALSERASLLAALAFSGAGFLHLWRAHPHSYVAALAPWILFALLQLARRPGGRSAVVLAVIGAIGVAAGHVETLLHVLIFGLAAALLLARRRTFGRLLGWGVVAALIAALLAAPLLLPFVENLLVSAEWELREGGPVEPVELPWPEVAIRLAPNLSLYSYGPADPGAWQGPPEENLIEVGGGWMSAAALLLLPAAFLCKRHRQTATVFILLGLVGLAVGTYVPGISRLFHAVPLLGDSLLKRLLLWWVLAVALAVGYAVDGLSRRRQGRGRIVALALGAGGVVVALAAVEAWTPVGISWLDGLVVALGLAGALGLVPSSGPAQAADIRRWGSLAATGLLAAALMVPAAVAFGRFIPLVSTYSFYPETEAIRFVQARLGTNPAGFRVAGLDAALVPHSATFFGLEDPRAYDPMTFAPYEAFARRLGHKGRFGWQRVLDPAASALAAMGTRFVFDHPSVGERPGVDRVYAGADAVVFENRKALPRLWVPREVIGLGEGADEVGCDAFGDVAPPGWDQARVVEAVVRELDDFARYAAVLAPCLARGVGELGQAARIEDLAVSPEGIVEARIVAEGPALVASSQPAIPGWRLAIDGEAAEPVRVNGAFLGALVPAGEHRVRFVYAPRSWRAGLALAALGIAGCALVLWLSGRAQASRITSSTRSISALVL